MKMQHFSPEQDGFYGVYYSNPDPGRKAFIAMLGDSSDDRMVVSGVKWLHKRGCNVMAMSSAKKDYGHHDYPLERFGKAIEMVYLIDDEYLFTGDTIWFGPDGGRSFINMLAEDNRVAIRSLAALEEKLRPRGLHLKIITGHTGWTDDLDFAFAHRDKVCNAYVKQKPHDPQAPYDGYDESSDTQEQARSIRLKKQM